MHSGGAAVALRDAGADMIVELHSQLSSGLGVCGVGASLHSTHWKHMHYGFFLTIPWRQS